ncbi:MAG: DUF262 domain-containing protein [Flavobacteriales bacterium]|nr:DUF262 domain-containing protein [Flavobacteriales bacterium]
MEKPIEFNLTRIFEKDNYIIPLYQRNYAWEENQVTQLVQDIWDYTIEANESNYYIGTLVVHKKEENNITYFETIDGQQRLTTLNILLSVLKNEFSVSIKNGFETKLQFASRPNSSFTLKSLCDRDLKSNNLNPKMHQAYLDLKKKLSNLFSTNSKIKNKFVEYLFQKVIILRVEVPIDTDLNHYFEIMNNRGEQLEKHEILKAELLVHLKENKNDSEAFSMIWDACSNMDIYVQYGFTTKYRNSIFKGVSWNKIPKSFEDFIISFNQVDNYKEIDEEEVDFLYLANSKNTYTIDFKPINDDDNTRFNSIITFPNFLLHVLRVFTKKDIPLDDKRLINTFKNELKNLNQSEKIKFVKDFGYSLLKARFLFDKYIIKREYKNDGDRWNLQKIKTGEKNIKYYASTFENNKQIIMLLSMFHVSFPQMIYKHWLNGVLKYLFEEYDKNEENKINKYDYINYLESMSDSFYYDRFGEVELDYYDIIYKNGSKSEASKIKEDNLHVGTNVQNFIFNRLDYLIWKLIVIEKNVAYKIDGIDKFEFSFRSSVEHFFPQNPKNGADIEDVGEDFIDKFGNLCLISRSKNSELSNYSPKAKAEHYGKSTTIESLKQQLMIQKKDKWDESAILNHQMQMIEILNQKA